MTNAFKRTLKAEGRSRSHIKAACDERRLGEWRRREVFVGKNLMGKILMLCRDAAIEGRAPDIDLNLLRSKRIHILCRRLTFRDFS